MINDQPTDILKMIFQLLSEREKNIAWGVCKYWQQFIQTTYFDTRDIVSIEDAIIADPPHYRIISKKRPLPDSYGQIVCRLLAEFSNDKFIRNAFPVNFVDIALYSQCSIKNFLLRNRNANVLQYMIDNRLIDEQIARWIILEEITRRLKYLFNTRIFIEKLDIQMDDIKYHRTLKELGKSDRSHVVSLIRDYGNDCVPKIEQFFTK